MIKYILKRLGYLILTLFLVASITFFLMKLLPGTPFNNPKLPPEQIVALKAQYGLDKPVWQQYLNYMVGLLHGDMGTSFQFAGQSVTYLIASRIGPSLQLGAQAMIVGTLLGILLGAIAAIRKNTWVDAVATILPSLAARFLTSCLQHCCSSSWLTNSSCSQLHCGMGSNPVSYQQLPWPWRHWQTPRVHADRDDRCVELRLYRTRPV